MEIFLEVLGVVLLAVVYFLLQTYNAKKSRIPSKLNKPELVPIIENSTTEPDKVSFEDLVDEMTHEDSEEGDFDNQNEDTEEHFAPSNNKELSKLEKEVIRLGKIVDKLASNKGHTFSYKKMLQNPSSARRAFVASEIFKPKFKSQNTKSH